jgi:hypothetical protein
MQDYLSLAVLLLNNGRILSDELLSKHSFRKDTLWSKLYVALIVIAGFSNVTGFKVWHICVKLPYKIGTNDTETTALHLATNVEKMSTTQWI